MYNPLTSTSLPSSGADPGGGGNKIKSGVGEVLNSYQIELMSPPPPPPPSKKSTCFAPGGGGGTSFTCAQKTIHFMITCRSIQDNVHYMLITFMYVNSIQCKYAKLCVFNLVFYIFTSLFCSLESNVSAFMLEKFNKHIEKYTEPDTQK